MHNLSFLDQSEQKLPNYSSHVKIIGYFLVMIIRKIYYKFCSLNSPSNTTLSQSLVDYVCGVPHG
jgi:hypothetical protein